MANRMIHTPSYLATADILKYWSAVSSQNGISGGWYVKGVTGALFTKIFDNQSGWTVGLKFLFTGSAYSPINLLDGGTSQCSLSFNNVTQKFTFARGATTILSGQTTLMSNTEYYIELQVVIADAPNGVAILKIDGVADPGINATNLNTRNTANYTANTVQFGADQSRFKDIYVNDNSGGVDDGFWGPIAIVTQRATGAGATSGWTPSAGSNWQNVDDTTPNDDTDYNKTSTADVVDTYAMSDSGYASGTVKGVELVADIRKADVSATARVAPVVRIGGADYVGTDLIPTTSYLLQNQRYRLQPVAGTPAWDVATLDAMEVGIKRTAA